MKRQLPVIRGIRRTSSKLSSLLLLFQRSPLIQMIFPEARILGGAGLGELTKWTVASVAGLGAFDTVAGATVLTQIAPTQNSTTVTGAVGSPLAFVYQVTGAPSAPESWQINGAIPSGMTHMNDDGQSVGSITGIPTQAGSFPITVTAWEKTGNSGGSVSENFTFTIGDAIIITHPVSVSVNSGSTAILSVTGSGSGLTYQWYSGDSPSISSPITNATMSTYTSPPLTVQAKYWVRVTRAGVIANSNTATVSVNPPATPPSITQQPSSSSINAGETAMLSVVTSGDPATYEWFEGSPPDTSVSVFTGGASFTTPALSATKTYWVKATNAGGSAESNAAVVTVLEPMVTWGNSHFTAPQLADANISGSGADPEHDGLTNEDEYVFGTSPLIFNSELLEITNTGANEVTLQFVAKQASGPGYFGMTRHYAVESRADLGSGQWDPVASYEDITASGQTVTVAFVPVGKRFYHLKAWLTP